MKGVGGKGAEVVPAIRKTGKYEAPKPRTLKKSEQLPLPPVSLPALIDEKPFMDFINEIQSAHEKVSRSSPHMWGLITTA